MGNLYNHDLITPAALETRQRMSIGKNFAAFVARKQSVGDQGENRGKPMPLWQRLSACPAPLLLLYGKQDRGGAAERAALAKQRYPKLDLYVVKRCRHLLQWDAAAEFITLTARFLGEGTQPTRGTAI